MFAREDQDVEGSRAHRQSKSDHGQCEGKRGELGKLNSVASLVKVMGADDLDAETLKRLKREARSGPMCWRRLWGATVLYK